MNKNTKKENNLERNNQNKLPQLQPLNLEHLDNISGGKRTVGAGQVTEIVE